MYPINQWESTPSILQQKESLIGTCQVKHSIMCQPLVKKPIQVRVKTLNLTLLLYFYFICVCLACRRASEAGRKTGAVHGMRGGHCTLRHVTIASAIPAYSKRGDVIFAYVRLSYICMQDIRRKVWCDRCHKRDLYASPAIHLKFMQAWTVCCKTDG